MASCARLLRNSRVRLGFCLLWSARLSRRTTADARVVRRHYRRCDDCLLHHRGRVVAVGQRGDPAPRRPCRLVRRRHSSGRRRDRPQSRRRTMAALSMQPRHGVRLGGSQFHCNLDNLGTLVRPPPRPRAQPRADRGKRRGVRRRTRTVDSEPAPRLGRCRARGRAEPVGGDCAIDLDRHPVAGRPTAAVGGSHSRAQGARDHRPQRGVAGCAVLVGRCAIRAGTISAGRYDRISGELSPAITRHEWNVDCASLHERCGNSGSARVGSSD